MNSKRAETAEVIDLRGAGTPTDDQIREVKFVDLGSEYASLKEEIDAAIQGVLTRTDFILGGAIADFENEFAAYCGTAHAIGVDSGFSALELILRAFDIGPGDEVITSANTFYSTVRSIEACGATPVLVDIEPRYRNLDPELLEAAITDRTQAIIPVHLYGHPADMASINEIANDHDLLVFEDACQAHGSTYHGDRAGSLADAAAFSFYPAKNLGAIGDAGIIVTDRPDIDHRIRQLRNLGSLVKYQHDLRGFNRRMDTIHAAVLQIKLRHLDEANQARRRVAARYDEWLADVDVTVPQVAPWAAPVYHLYVIETPDRDALGAALGERGIQTGIHYPVPIHLQPAFESLGYRLGDFPETEALADRILSLPMHPYLTADEVEFVADAIRESNAVRTAVP